VDMRIRSLHMLEHLPGSVNLTMSTLPGALKNGPARDFKKNELIIIYGDLYPHFDAPHAFRAAGFDAVYCLEGGMKLWKERGYPVETRPDFAEFGQVLESEKPVAHPGDSSTVVDPENIGPMALKTAMDLGLKPMIIFVGDEATYRSGHIPGAIRIAQPDILKRFESESEDRNRLIVLYCGCCEGIAKGLSGTALFQLKGIGYKRLLNLEGHLKAWKDAGLPLVKEDPMAPEPPK
ncbi:MAG TPA: rhodanese-like domain-containing protein, partial [Gemmatimonadales bacterium]|nr:rhodanese-like domain-containing protein [Gemmatimonadales bacterium]